MKEQDIFNTNPLVSTIICSIIGISLIGDLTTYEQNTLGNWLLLIGQELVTNAASQNLIQARAGPSSENINSKKVKSVYNPIIYDINTLIEVLKSTNYDSYKNCINLFDKSINKINEQINKFKN